MKNFWSYRAQKQGSHSKLKTEFHDSSMTLYRYQFIFPGNKTVAQSRFGCMSNLPKFLLFAYIVFTSKDKNMQPPVVKYQAEKETQVRKEKFCKINSDIENKCEYMLQKQNSIIFPIKWLFF